MKTEVMLRDSRKTRLNLARFQSFNSGIFLTLNTFCWMFNLELNRNVWNLLFYESHVVVITNFNKYGNIFCLQLHTIKWKRCMKQLHVWRDIINIEPMSVIAYLINLLKNNITIKCNMNSSSERCKCSGMKMTKCVWYLPRDRGRRVCWLLEQCLFSPKGLRSGIHQYLGHHKLW